MHDLRRTPAAKIESIIVLNLRWPNFHYQIILPPNAHLQSPPQQVFMKNVQHGPCGMVHVEKEERQNIKVWTCLTINEYRNER